MFISPTDVLNILEHYKYAIIFPIAIFEGPIIIVITGFLANLGILNVFVAYCVVVVADIIGDSLYYSIGRFGGRSTWLKKYGHFFGYSENSEKFLENHFKKHKVKTFLIAKVTHGLGGTVQIVSGIARVTYVEFLLLSLLGTIPKTLVLFVLGFYVGQSYVKIDNYLHYIAFFTLGGVILVVLYFVVLKKITRNYLNKG